MERCSRPLDIDRAAWLLIRKYRDDSAIEAFRRSCHCECRGDVRAAAEWRLVLKKVVELQFIPRRGPLH